MKIVKHTARFKLSAYLNLYPWSVSKLLNLKRKKWARRKNNFQKPHLFKRVRYMRFFRTFKKKTMTLFKRYFGPGLSDRQATKLVRSNTRYKASFANVLKLEYRLDTLLVRMFFIQNLSFAREMIRMGCIRVNQNLCVNPARVIEVGDYVEPSTPVVWQSMYNSMLSAVASFKKYLSRIFFKMSFPYVLKRKQFTVREQGKYKHKALPNTMKRYLSRVRYAVKKSVTKRTPRYAVKRILQHRTLSVPYVHFHNTLQKYRNRSVALRRLLLSTRLPGRVYPEVENKLRNKKLSRVIKRKVRYLRKKTYKLRNLNRRPLNMYSVFKGPTLDTRVPAYRPKRPKLAYSTTNSSRGSLRGIISMQTTPAVHKLQRASLSLPTTSAYKQLTLKDPNFLTVFDLYLSRQRRSFKLRGCLNIWSQALVKLRRRKKLWFARVIPRKPRCPWQIKRLTKKYIRVFRYLKKFNHVYPIYKAYQKAKEVAVCSNGIKVNRLTLKQRARLLQYPPAQQGIVHSSRLASLSRLYGLYPDLYQADYKSLEQRVLRIKPKYLKVRGFIRSYMGYKVQVELPNATSRIIIKYKKIDTPLKQRPINYYMMDMNYNTLAFTLLSDVDLLFFPYRTLLNFKTIAFIQG